MLITFSLIVISVIKIEFIFDHVEEEKDKKGKEKENSYKERNEAEKEGKERLFHQPFVSYTLDRRMEIIKLCMCKKWPLCRVSVCRFEAMRHCSSGIDLERANKCSANISTQSTGHNNSITIIILLKRLSLPQTSLWSFEQQVRSEQGKDEAFGRGFSRLL